MMATQGVDTRTRFTHRVNLSALRPDNSYEIYSSLFVSQLLALVTDLDAKCTYRLTGEIITEENAAVFPLNTLQEVDSLEAEYQSAGDAVIAGQDRVALKETLAAGASIVALEKVQEGVSR